MIFIRHTESQKTEGLHVGGKATNLFRLIDVGFTVPPFVVIPQETLTPLIPQELLKGNNWMKIQSFINSYTFDQSFIDQILSTFKTTPFFAVRSSAIDEDGSDFSFAGQFESHLFVAPDQLSENIKKVWKSAFSERVFHYRINNNLSLKTGIAVIIQQMIDAEVSGVAFGINPVTGNRKSQLISAVYGLGEGLVSGELNADNYELNDGKIIKSEVVDKSHKLVFDISANTGIVKAEVEDKIRKVPCLSESQLKQIEQVLDKSLLFFGKPQDIEYAFANNTLYLLQARPITNLSKTPDVSSEHIIWDNSNIIESYPGLTLPLTFSFILKVYEAVYIQFTKIMGVNDEDIQENANTYANMLGILNGRVYYNLLSWYKLLALLPGYSINAEFMEKMMGVKERFELKNLKVRTKFNDRLRVLNMVWLTIKNLRALPDMRKQFVADFNATMKKYDVVNFSKCGSHELMTHYMNFEQTLLKKWKAPLVNDFFAMIYFGVLQKLVVKYSIDNANTVHNDLLCGSKDIISVEPIKRVLNISKLISEDEKAIALFRNKLPVEIIKALKEGAVPIVANAINEYIQLFGERCVAELKLETITYKQDATALVKLIKSYVEQGIKTNENAHFQDIDVRREAEEKVAKALSGKPLKKILFNYILRKTRDLVSARENLRYERTRAFGMVRRIFIAVGNNFYSEGLIDHPRDIFYLTKEEIFSFIQGTSVFRDIKKIIAERKIEYSTFEKEKTAERIDTYGIVYHGNDFNKVTVSTTLSGDLKGIGCCPGRVRAKVRVIHNPDEIESLNGDILVTSSTDPGWVTLFPSASAILVERGSLLSHSAIVSREMGKPCIVGITGLLSVLKTGDEVEMDGATGEVKICR